MSVLLSFGHILASEQGYSRQKLNHSYGFLMPYLLSFLTNLKPHAAARAFTTSELLEAPIRSFITIQLPNITQ